MSGLLRVAALLCCVLCVGCGYRLAGGGSGVLPDSVRVVAVTTFENRTARTEIEQRVTEEVAREFSRRGRYKVVTDPAGADALLEGAITDFRTNPVQFNSEGRATRVETVVLLRATLRDLRTDQVLWQQANLPFREQYDVPESALDISDTETLALEEIARGAAGALVSSMLEGF